MSIIIRNYYQRNVVTLEISIERYFTIFKIEECSFRNSSSLITYIPGCTPSIYTNKSQTFAILHNLTTKSRVQNSLTNQLSLSRKISLSRFSKSPKSLEVCCKQVSRRCSPSTDIHRVGGRGKGDLGPHFREGSSRFPEA